MYTYAWYHWLTFFYLYCFFGWCFESAYVSIRQHHPINRGFLRMPMLPLYGTGAIMMLWVSLPVKDNLFLVYLSGVIAATILEYVTGYLMELLFKVKYWDYSNQRFNLNGYICLSSSIAWGFLTILMTEVIHRPVERLVLNMNPFSEATFLITVTILFAMDTIHSTREALDLAKALETVTRLRGELDELQVQMALLKAEAAQNMQNLKESLEQAQQEVRAEVAEVRAGYMEALETPRELLGKPREAYLEALGRQKDAYLESLEKQKGAYLESLEKQKDAYRESLEQKKAALDARIAGLSTSLTEKSLALRQHIETHRPAILHRNPGASSRRFASALKELRGELRSSLENRKPF